jgi:hypothetical protein
MLTAKTAKELAVDMSIRGNTPATAPAARK